MTDVTPKDFDESTPYICDEPGCSRRFKRSDHLLRHKRNHSEKSFECSWPGCSKTFVRKDVRSKHFKRHFAKEEKIRQKKDQSIKFFELYTPESADAIRIPMNDEELGSPFQHQRSASMHEPIDSISTHTSESLQPSTSLEFQSPTNSIEKQPEIKDVELENLIEIFLNDNQDSSKYFEYSPSSSLKELLDGTPDFNYSTSQSILSEEMKLKMIHLIPSLATNELFEAEHIEKYLNNYWGSYHIQFPIIHRPTFSTSKANPLLLLSMITIGASSMSKTYDDKLKAKQFLRLAEQIAQPLRWLICSETEFFPIVTSWIIQSLLILECFEITSSNRRFHRRANLHHGLKIELLRRSPLLGGDPLKSFEDDKELGPWENWIEIESLKRCAYVAFLVDTYNATIFGHDTIIYPHHIQLSLPCSEDLWENSFQSNYTHMTVTNSSSDSTSSSSSTSGNEKFLLLIAKILRKNHLNCSPLTNQLLLGGLISLSLQMEQKDLPSKILQSNVSRSNWKSDLLASLDYWYDNVINGSCCESSSAYYYPQELMGGGFPIEDSSCKFAIYHISQAFLRLSQYDCIIYAGAPTRMNVKANHKDFEIVKERILKWANSVNGKISVTHAYILICETLLGKDEHGNEITINYDPNKDPIFYRPNIIASALFLIWAYNFCLYGPESNYYGQLPKENQTSFYTIVSTCFHEKLNGYTYIKRAKKCFLLESKNIRGSKLFWQYSSNLDQIPNKNFTVGLLRLFNDKYLKCNSQICIEYGKLMENCIQRSLGRVSVTCEDMYESSEL